MIPTENYSKTKTILIVDDDPDVSKVISMLLTSLGYRVIHATGGYQAIEIYIEKKDIIDLVILDLMMPDLSGEQTFKALKRVDDNVKVVISSGFIPEESAGELFDQGCLAFLPKPYTMLKLKTVLSGVIP